MSAGLTKSRVGRLCRTWSAGRSQRANGLSAARYRPPHRPHRRLHRHAKQTKLIEPAKRAAQDRWNQHGRCSRDERHPRKQSPVSDSTLVPNSSEAPAHDTSASGIKGWRHGRARKAKVRAHAAAVRLGECRFAGARAGAQARGFACCARSLRRVRSTKVSAIRMSRYSCHHFGSA